MPKVVVYSSKLCGFCYRAKGLLSSKGVAFEEINVDMKPQVRAEMRSRAGGVNTVPQIFIDDIHVGGCDDLYALDSAGKLDPLLAAG
ncbi:glutaredoxin 3 [Kordiimonas sediminis]|uniref:Glutaredoxin n=1 Tax=Kordiimonas sediminis TaxID=1735581 RepID=A0A919AKM4_9PROT|nr:glutaredoxin 3 [Kordiimonas sediminis]GHF10518.1 glutaredoxin 3 [Kordiimonas sediminis]